MPHLTEQFKATFGDAMLPVELEEAPPFDFWPYFETIPQADFLGYDCSEGIVEHAWREPAGRYEHVLVSSNDPDVFMVLILDRRAGVVYGHRLLNLKTEYGLS